ncbi:MAG TPA: DUF2752 domain-containing protein, partial [Gemmataceae bacterium]
DRSRATRILLQIQRFVAALLFAGYGLWNLYWLAQGCIPPSIFLKVTGWPCPTTGGTRAIIQLCHGVWHESLRYNAMAIPIIVLLALSLGWLARQAVAKTNLNLPLGIFWSWVIVLGVAWVLKLTGDPLYW